MKIGMTVGNLAVSGGYQKLVLRLGEELEAAGHEVTLYALEIDRDACYPEIGNGLRIVGPVARRAAEPVALGRPHRRYLELAKPPARLATIKSVAAQMSADLDALIIHDEETLHFLRHRSFPRTVWMVNNEPSHAFDPVVGQVMRAIGDRSRKRGIVERLVSIPGLAAERRLLRGAVGKVDRFAVYDTRNAERVAELFRARADVVYAGADLDDFASLAAGRVRKAEETLTLLSVGVVFPYRRYEDIIEALALLRDEVDIRLTVVGVSQFAPEYAAQLRELARQRRVDQLVTFIEHATAPDLRDLYRNADVFVFVNDGRTWGISVFEAVAACIPVIITDNVGAADLLTDARHAVLVPPRAPTEIANALRRLAAEPEWGKDLARLARSEALEVVRWSAYTQRMLALLD